jgi:hypothetical protein
VPNFQKDGKFLFSMYLRRAAVFLTDKMADTGNYPDISKIDGIIDKNKSL